MSRADATPIDAYLQVLWDNNGSDLLLTSGSPPLIRVDGSLRPIPDTPPLTPEVLAETINAILSEEMAERYEAEREIDFSFAWGHKSRFRANAFHQRGTACLAVRAIPFKIPSFTDLGLPPVTEKLVNLPHGLILVTGPTGSGKSTTMASMIDYINRHRACHIITLEDPIEYIHNHARSAVNQREVGEDTHSFPRALRACLREDPDVVLVGEMRDLETIRIALTVAETGHLVFATLHTNDTSQALDRIVDVFPAEQQQQIRVQLASSLQAIIYQQLLVKTNGGRAAAFEVLLATNPVRNLIRDGKSNQIRNIVVTNASEGMQTFEASLSDLIAQGAITYMTAVTKSLFPKEIRIPQPAGTPGPLPSTPGRGR